MKARPPKPGSGDVRGLMAELSDLVDDLGLHHIDAPVPPEAPANPDEQPAATADVLPLAAPDAPRAPTPPPRSARAGGRPPRPSPVPPPAAGVGPAASSPPPRLAPGHTSGPATAVTHTPFVADGLRAVAARSPADVPAARTTEHFPATATAVYLDVTYRNVTAGHSLRIVIPPQPPPPAGPPATSPHPIPA